MGTEKSRGIPDCERELEAARTEIVMLRSEQNDLYRIIVQMGDTILRDRRTIDDLRALLADSGTPI